MKFFIAFTLLISVLSCTGQSQSDRVVLGKSYADRELKDALLDTTMPNLVRRGSLLIKTKEIAIAIIEPLLFSIYGEKNIKTQRPYEAYLINTIG